MFNPRGAGIEAIGEVLAELFLLSWEVEQALLEVRSKGTLVHVGFNLLCLSTVTHFMPQQ